MAARCSMRARTWASGRTGSPPSSRLRIESGLIFLGYDYFQGVTSPFHVNLDRMIKLDKAEVRGADAPCAPSTRPGSPTAW